mmetsp:Transcript_25122/g.28904  ORF Transcript_25122/g.28904 Transcript_25122/m.28904 type:complete len:104 (+) Transcript_25122:295-606(+)
MEELSDDESGKGKKSKNKEKPGKASASVNCDSADEDENEDAKQSSPTPNVNLAENKQTVAQDCQDDESSEWDELLSYPHKKHMKRLHFLKSWRENFSKPWDAI